jgi:hypothetical protein
MHGAANVATGTLRLAKKPCNAKTLQGFGSGFCLAFVAPRCSILHCNVFIKATLSQCFS